MSLDEGGEGTPLSALARLMQGLPPGPRRRGLFGREYERFMGARRPNSAQLLAGLRPPQLTGRGRRRRCFGRSRC